MTLLTHMLENKNNLIDWNENSFENWMKSYLVHIDVVVYALEGHSKAAHCYMSMNAYLHMHHNSPLRPCSIAYSMHIPRYPGLSL